MSKIYLTFVSICDKIKKPVRPQALTHAPAHCWKGNKEEAGGEDIMWRSLKKLFRICWDEYPVEHLLYVCSHNGVTGVVRAEDFDDEVRRMRREFEKSGWPKDPLGWELRPVRPQVFPVFLFSDKNPSDRSFRVGTLAEMRQALDGYCVEERSFELPPINAPGMIRSGYYGHWESVGRENTRHRAWTLEQARRYFRGGHISTYNL